MNRLTPWWWLVALTVGIGGISYVVVDHRFGDLPPLRLTAGALLAIFGLVVSYLAVSTRARLARRAGTRTIDPLIVTRLVALAKASSLVGSAVVGGLAGYLAVAVRVESPSATSDLRASVVALVGALLVTGGGLALERVCRIPSDDDAG